jgi:hypothetical protein
VQLTATLTLRNSEIQLPRKSAHLFILDKTPIFLATWLLGLAHVLHPLLFYFRSLFQYRAPHQSQLPIHLPFILDMHPSIHITLLLLTLTILSLMHLDIIDKPAP